MSWPLHQIVVQHWGDGGNRHGLQHAENTWWIDRKTGSRPTVGDVFFHRRFRYHCPGEPSPDYRKKNRLPIVIVCPGNVWLSPDFIYNPADKGWVVTGEQKGPPMTWLLEHITVTPSINIVGIYHGWLKGGILSDDLEGRTYQDA